MRRGFAEYEDAGRMLSAIRALEGQGYRVCEAYSPYAVPEVDQALKRAPSRLPWLVFCVGIGAALGAYGLEWLLNAYLYPLNVGHRPAHYFLAFVPISFEMGILFASFAAVAALLVAGRLLRLHDPVFELDGFETATRDAFWLSVALDDRADELAEQDLRGSGARHVVLREWGAS